eukprot:scaffold6985_cov57-Phaeocystis_antarctica.AAC.5
MGRCRGGAGAVQGRRRGGAEAVRTLVLLDELAHAVRALALVRADGPGDLRARAKLPARRARREHVRGEARSR